MITLCAWCPKDAPPMHDDGRSVTITGCDRLNRRAVRCWINETDVLMPFYVNGQRVIGNADWLAIATLRNGRVSTHLN